MKRGGRCDDAPVAGHQGRGCIGRAISIIVPRCEYLLKVITGHTVDDLSPGVAWSPVMAGCYPFVCLDHLGEEVELRANTVSDRTGWKLYRWTMYDVKEAMYQTTPLRSHT
jgi:hypothetical protein